MRIETLEFDHRDSVTWLLINGTATLVSGMKGVNRRTYLFSDYLLCFYLDELKQKGIDLFEHDMGMEELLEIARQIGLDVRLAGTERIVVIRHSIPVGGGSGC